jgi:type VI secretion system secreted protein VgrG
MAETKQADRLMQFTSQAGKDVLVIESIEGGEGISRLFEYNVDLLASADTSIDPTALVGSKVTVAIGLNDVDGFRYINGIVASFDQSAGDAEFNVYRARIVPSMWQLTLSANCRVFQSKTVLDIAKEVIGEYTLSLSDQTTGSYEVLEYCTQYSESDFQFVSRILEESGIFYWFEHSDQDNKIVLGDDRNAYQDCPLSSTVPYALNSRGAEGAYGAMITEFTSTATMVSGKHSTSDYNYRNFARADATDKNSASPYGKNAFDQYLYPAGAEGYADGATQPTSDIEDLFIETRVQASDAMAEVLRGVSNARSLCAGYTFSMEDHPRDEWNRKYLLTTVTMSADQVPPYRASDQGKDEEYSNQFTAVSSDIVYKPAKTFRKPRIYGPQTALVVGPSGEEIYLDDLGRIKVRFFWDKKDDRDSTVNTTWVRVAQPWAGNGWGAYFWPRVKDEVVVQFLNGDPDNPVVTGSVYNAINTVPYPLPDNSTRSGIMTRSSKGGSAANANELRFEDKKGDEQVYIHAEKDMDVSIEHDRRISVGNNDSLIVTGNQTEEIDQNFNRNIKSNLVENISSNADLYIGGNLTEAVGGNHALNVSSSQSIQVGSAYSLDCNGTVYINAATSLVIQAGMELSLVAGGNFVTIGPSGVAISGVMVLINSGGAAGSGSAGSVPSPQSPNAPDKADTSGGSGGGTLGSSSSSPASSSSSSPAGASSPGVAAIQAINMGSAPAAAGAAASQAEQGAQQAAAEAQQAASQAEQAAQQAAQQAQQAANQATQEARQAYQQAAQAVQQAQAAVAQAAAQGKAAAQQALSQAEQQAQQCAQAGAQAAQQAQQQAQQVEQQAQQTAAQAQQAAQQAAAQAQQAAKAAEQQGQAAAQQAEQAAKQAAAQAQQAAKQAQQQAQQAQQQVKQAASQAQQQAQQASKAAQQSASQASNQAKGLL